MNKNFVILLIVLAGVAWGEVQSCTSCGPECKNACGTKHFRACCFNYIKKRSSVLDPSLRLELWLARSRNTYPGSLADLEIPALKQNKPF